MVEHGRSLEDQEKWAELSGSGTEACPAAGRVTSIPEPLACRQYRIGLATVGDFQTSLESSHFFVAAIKSCTVCTERQNWRCLEWLRAFQEAIWNISFSISMGHLCASSGHPAPQHDRWLQPSLGVWHLGLPSGPYHVLAV